MWQDIALFIFNLMFIAVTIPQIVHMKKTGECMSAWMCGPTVIGLFGCAAVWLTLDLPLAATVNVISGILWSVLFVISLRNGKPKETTN